MLNFSRRSLFAVAVVAATPLTMFVTACGSDSSTSPKSTPSVDTIAFGANNTTLDEYYVDSTQSPPTYDYESWNDDESYVEVQNNGGSSQSWDTRILLSFQLPTLVGRGVVDSAKVFQYQCDWSASDGTPFTTGSVVLDHVNWGASLSDSVAFAGGVVQDSVGTVSSDTTIGWRSVDVTSSVKADYAAKRAMSQYRMRISQSTYTPDSDFWVEFDNGNSGEDCNYSNGSNHANGSQGYAVVWSH